MGRGPDITIDLKTGSRQRYQVIADSIRLAYTSAVEGDIGEFGIFMGNSWRVIAMVMKMCDASFGTFIDAPRILHGFDSFQGLPASTHPADTGSPMVARGFWGEGTCASPGELEILKLAEAFLPADRIRLYPGWFSETLPTLSPTTRFAVVHVDCDLYESTVQVLTDLFEKKRISDGAILLFDDFFENRSSKKLGQRRAWEECKARFDLDITELGHYGDCSWRCIVHER